MREFSKQPLPSLVRPLAADTWPDLRRWAAAAMMFASCACSSVDRPRASNSDPFVAGATAAAESAEPGRAIAFLRPAGLSPVQPAGYSAPANPGGGDVRHASAEIRDPFDCPPCPEGCLGSCPVCDERFPDEYLCDGGDRALPVHYNDRQMLGLETEDTVVEFEDDDGRRKVKHANKICVYSPRFASVVALSGATEDIGGGRPTQAIATVRGVGLKARDGTFVNNQTEMTERLVSRSRGSSLVSRDTAQEFDRPQAIHGHVHTTTPLTGYNFLETGRIHQSESAWIEGRIDAASIWTRVEHPSISATTEGAGEAKGVFIPEEFAGQENRFKGKARLRIVKLADKDAAAPGDVITFKIRYDNIGDRPVSKVVIVDNLTPRLEYVDDSATSDRDGELLTDDNGEGSLILRWELDEPLPGRAGGIVTFQARVR